MFICCLPVSRPRSSPSAGDLILFGTGEGFGLIQSGDVVEIEVEGIGRLRNPVGLVEDI